jgi:hypothetical protein
VVFHCDALLTSLCKKTLTYLSHSKYVLNQCFSLFPVSVCRRCFSSCTVIVDYAMLDIPVQVPFCDDQAFGHLNRPHNCARILASERLKTTLEH